MLGQQGVGAERTCKRAGPRAALVARTLVPSRRLACCGHDALQAPGPPVKPVVRWTSETPEGAAGPRNAVVAPTCCIATCGNADPPIIAGSPPALADQTRPATTRASHPGSTTARARHPQPCQRADDAAPVPDPPWGSPLAGRRGAARLRRGASRPRGRSRLGLRRGGVVADQRHSVMQVVWRHTGLTSWLTVGREWTALWVPWCCRGGCLNAALVAW